ncbi:hypothetical protein [Tuwongella immobilis]|uniref:HEAT repeat domain-containing protein n=1 Tax=Tuwongella immobilis TaxID=692036 RepID=A0A6C2YIN7_9BACT
MPHRIRVWTMALIGVGTWLTPLSAQREPIRTVGIESIVSEIQQSQADVSKRVEAVRALAALDCRYFPDAERQLMRALRADPSEEVRLETAIALGKGCCDTRAIQEVLRVSALGTAADGYPQERSDRVRQQSALAMRQIEHRMAPKIAGASVQPVPARLTSGRSPATATPLHTQAPRAQTAANLLATPVAPRTATLLQPLSQAIPPARLMTPSELAAASRANAVPTSASPTVIPTRTARTPISPSIQPASAITPPLAPMSKSVTPPTTIQPVELREPVPVLPPLKLPEPISLTPVAPTPVATTPIAPMPVAPMPVAPMAIGDKLPPLSIPKLDDPLPDPATVEVPKPKLTVVEATEPEGPKLPQLPKVAPIPTIPGGAEEPAPLPPLDLKPSSPAPAPARESEPMDVDTPAPAAKPEVAAPSIDTPIPLPKLPPIVIDTFENTKKAAPDSAGNCVRILTQSLDRLARLDALRQLQPEDYEHAEVVAAVLERVQADPDATIRYNAARALMRHALHTEAVRAALPRWATHRDRLVRYEATLATQRLAAENSPE